MHSRRGCSCVLMRLVASTGHLEMKVQHPSAFEQMIAAMRQRLRPTKAHLFADQLRIWHRAELYRDGRNPLAQDAVARSQSVARHQACGANSYTFSNRSARCLAGALGLFAWHHQAVQRSRVRQRLRRPQQRRRLVSPALLGMPGEQRARR